MRTTWVIEHGIFDNELALIEEVRKQGNDIIEIDYKHNYYIDDICRNPKYRELLEQPTIFRGSLNLSREVSRITDWIPGTYCNRTNFNCSTYYTYWGKYMLNNNYSLKSVSETIRTWNANLTMFVRPDSGFKQFNGGKYTLDEFVALKLPPELLVISSTPKRVNVEWRFVVANGVVITGSEYLPYESTYNTERPSTYLQSVLYQVRWQPDFIYTVDVCQSNGEFYILELNSFSCSNLYSCDIAAVVEVASKLAIDEWTDINE